MGLTGGIADVGSLYDSLAGIHTGQADDSILGKYDEVRRRIWHEIINPISSENMTRLFKYANPDEAMEKDPFFRMVKRMEESNQERDEPPNVSVMCVWSRQSADLCVTQPGLPSLRYDMTQHYSQ
jgi:2-polyprenyl-6-methoxyphenol hydroxylase-like FAD-dependent oxidoreductase